MGVCGYVYEYGVGCTHTGVSWMDTGMYVANVHTYMCVE